MKIPAVAIAAAFAAGIALGCLPGIAAHTVQPSFLEAFLVTAASCCVLPL
jgi:hypothetical protein